MIAAIFFLFVFLAIIVFVPIAVIWALNTLFLLGIAFTFKTWLATLLLLSVVGNAIHSDKK